MNTIVNYINGDSYYGEIKNDLKHGKGEFQTKEYIYIGDFKDDKFNGFGKMTYIETKYIFEGYFNNNKKNGLGTFHTKFYTYIGEFKDDLFNGYGRIFNSLVLYEGMFKNNKKNGLGIETYKNSDFYIGYFKEDLKDGFGLYFYSKGGYYHGIFKENKQNEFGHLLKKDLKTNYIGHYKNGFKEGWGTYYYEDNNLYSGEFKNDKKNGVGLFQYNEDIIYLGEMKDDQKYGFGGILNLKNKNNYYGKFKNDNLVDLELQDDRVFKIYKNFKFMSSIKEYNLANNIKKYSIELKNNDKIEEYLKEPIFIILKKYVYKNILTNEAYLKIFSIINNEVNPNIILGNLEKTLFYSKEDLLNFMKEYYLELNINKIYNINWEFYNIILSKNVNEIEYKKYDIKDFILTNQIISGNINNNNLKGIIYNNKSFKYKIFNENEKNIEIHDGHFCKNYLVHFDNNNKLYFSFIKSFKYKGTFQIENCKTKNPLILYFSIFNDIIYNIGSDQIGSFIITGKILKKKIYLRQKYYLGYEIYYHGNFEEDKIVI